MPRASAGVVGAVDLNTGPDLTGQGSKKLPSPSDPAFWTGAIFLGAVLFLAFTYFGGFRRV
jgi:hypothetical protein